MSNMKKSKTNSKNKHKKVVMDTIEDSDESEKETKPKVSKRKQIKK